MLREKQQHIVRHRHNLRLTSADTGNFPVGRHSLHGGMGEFMHVDATDFLFGQPICDIVDAIHVKSMANFSRPPAAVRPALKPPNRNLQQNLSWTGAKSHARTSSPREPPICRPAFKPKNALKKEEANILCRVPGCGYIAQSPRHMLRHSTTHTGERRFACTFAGCEYRAKQREHLRTHLLTHSDLKPFECPLCDFATKRKEHLTRHLKRHKAGDLNSMREQ